MKKWIAAGAAALVLLVGSAGGVRYATSDDAPCIKPRTLLQSEQEKSIAVLEAYIEENIAGAYKDPQFLNWGSDDYAPVLLPNKIAARIMIINMSSVSSKPVYFHVTLVRDCVGGEWKVVEFKKLSR